MLIWALLLHLGFAVWMYGNSDLLVSGPVKVGNSAWEDKYQTWVDKGSGVDKIGLGPKLLRANVFPIALLFFIIVLVKLMRKFVAGPILALIRWVAHVCVCVCVWSDCVVCSCVFVCDCVCLE